jgi:ankyrin repeat protein
MTPEERCAEFDRVRKVETAFREGSLKQLREALEGHDVIPNGILPRGVGGGSCLEYAIYRSPITFIRELLELGADPNFDDPGGFPPLIAALSCSRTVAGSSARSDVCDILRLLLQFRADPNQRGINDYTPLHMAVTEGNLEAVEVLLHHGADKTLRTRIDEYETPLEMAEKAGLHAIAAMLSKGNEKKGNKRS